MRIRSLAGAVILIFAWSGLLTADVTSVTVDMEKKSVDPSNPRVNTARGSALGIQVLDNGKPTSGSVIITIAGAPASSPMPILTKVAMLTATSASIQLQSSVPFIQFRPCASESEKTGLCPSVTLSNDNVFQVVMKRGSLYVHIELTTGVVSAGATTTTKKDISFVLDVDQRKSALVYAGGLAGFGVRDERYRLVPDVTDAKSAHILQVPGGDIKKTIAASANYMGCFGPQSIGISFAVGSNPSLDALSFVGGPTFSIMTFDNKNSFYITPGVGYTRHQKLAAEFHGQTTIPASTPVASLTKDADGWGFALMIHFGFAGNADAFKFLSGGK
jgi:hypothetical protein